MTDKTGKETNLWIALAGIIATAIVGLAAAGATWWTARDDRANARALSRAALINARLMTHDTLVYSRRANAYTRALNQYGALAQEIRDHLGAYVYSPQIARLQRHLREALRQSPLSVELEAFATPPAHDAITQLLVDVQELAARVPPQTPWYDAVTRVLKDYDALGDAVRKDVA